MPPPQHDAVRNKLRRHTFLTCGGVETYLEHQRGVPLREFCAFEVLEDESLWRDLMRDFLGPTLSIAARYGHGFVADCLTWRASPAYLRRLGYPAAQLAEINQRGVRAMRDFVAAWCATHALDCPILMSAELGPQGDAYAVVPELSVAQANAYHRLQLQALADCGVEVVTALTLSNLNEIIGIAEAAQTLGIALILSPTVERDGRLADGTTLARCVADVDARTDGYPLGYMINCAHPLHLTELLAEAAEHDASWLSRWLGCRANASVKTHAELDGCGQLDRGDPAELGRLMGELQRRYGWAVLGGCCGTDLEHIEAIAAHCAVSAMLP